MLLAFLIFVVLLSGLVAYSADKIARKVGRSHLRLFGLRPKSTALIVAVAAGMGISLASVLTFGVLNRAAIRNILQADKLRVELGQLKKDVAATNSDLRTVQVERDNARQLAARSRQETQSAQQDLQAATTRLQATQAARTQLQGEVGKLQGRVEALSQRRSDLEAQARRNQAALDTSRAALQESQAKGRDQAATLRRLDEQIRALDARTAAAENKASQAEQQAARAEQQTHTLQAQTQQLESSRAAVQAQLSRAQQNRDDALSERATAQRDLQAAVLARNAALQERSNLLAQRDTLITQRDAAAKDRDAVRGQVSSLRTALAALEGQRLSLSAANDALRSSLSDTRADLSRLEVDYSRANSELSAGRNLDLVYSRNDLVYAAVVPSVRNVNDFLQAANAAAVKQGARGNPAARLNPQARAALDSKLRGLNTNTFVQCRAAVNVAVGFAVDLSCEARPQTVLFKKGQIIKQVSINLQRGTEELSNQINGLTSDAVVALTSRGVPLEYVSDKGLSDTERLDLLGKLGAQSGPSVVVGLAPKDDVRPGSKVNLYAVLLPFLR